MPLTGKASRAEQIQNVFDRELRCRDDIIGRAERRSVQIRVLGPEAVPSIST